MIKFPNHEIYQGQLKLFSKSVRIEDMSSYKLIGCPTSIWQPVKYI